MDESPILKVENLTKKYTTFSTGGFYAVNNISFEIKKGEVFGFLGRNGAGKTTTIKMICGLLIPTSGKVFIDGIEMIYPSSRRKLGYLPEQPYFYEYLTPYETIDFYGQLKGLNKKERQQEWSRVSELLELKPIADIRIKNFSKGMRQKIGFAIALIGDPDLLVLDEPMSGLDPVGRKHIRELILQQKEMGKTIFFSSHVLSDVEQVCDRVGVLSRGNLVAVGHIREVLQQEIRQVEVTLKDVDPSLLPELKQRGVLLKMWDNFVQFRFGNIVIANQTLAECLQKGASVIEFIPQRETLEDYFMRMQLVEETQLKKNEIYYSRVEE